MFLACVYKKQNGSGYEFRARVAPFDPTIPDVGYDTLTAAADDYETWGFRPLSAEETLALLFDTAPHWTQFEDLEATAVCWFKKE